MAKLNSHNILILRKLVENGYHTKRDIIGLPMYELLRIRTLSRGDLETVCLLQEALRKEDLLSFLTEEKEDNCETGTDSPVGLKRPVLGGRRSGNRIPRLPARVLR